MAENTPEQDGQDQQSQIEKQRLANLRASGQLQGDENEAQTQGQDAADEKGKEGESFNK